MHDFVLYFVSQMDPSGVQAARQTSLAEKKRRMKASSQQQQITPIKVDYLNLLHHSFLLAFVTHHVSSSHLQGWTQSSKMKPLPVKAIEGPDTVRIVLMSSTLFCGACTSVNFAMLFQIPVPASTPANELKSVHKFVIQNGKTRVTSQVSLLIKRATWRACVGCCVLQFVLYCELILPFS